MIKNDNGVWIEDSDHIGTIFKDSTKTSSQKTYIQVCGNP